MSVAQAMYPDTIQIGDVCKVDFTQYIGKVGYGGSPLPRIYSRRTQGEEQDCSGNISKALTIIKPKYFLLENVASMKNEDRDAITAVLWYINPKV